MSALIHRFLPGIRAETEVQYQVTQRAGNQFHLLHCQQSAVDWSCGVQASLQAVKVLTGISRKEVDGIPYAKAGYWKKFFEMAKELFFIGADDADIQRLLAPLGPAIESEVLQFRTLLDAGRQIRKAVLAGQVPVIRYEVSPSNQHWVTVVGVEEVEGQSVTALLLLDPASLGPWCCMFNARLDIKTLAASSSNTSRRYPTPLRHISGEAQGARLISVVVIKRSLGQKKS